VIVQPSQQPHQCIKAAATGGLFSAPSPARPSAASALALSGIHGMVAPLKSKIRVHSYYYQPISCSFGKNLVAAIQKSLLRVTSLLRRFVLKFWLRLCRVRFICGESIRIGARVSWNAD
jgi:hypothetical protein